jgi:hypothetical protein
MGEGPNNADRRDRQRLTVPEAATVLGATVDAVRGRIRRGRLEAEHDEHGTVYVFIDAEEANRRRPSEASRGPSPTVEGPSPDSRLVEVLEDQVEHLRAQLDAERAANRENRRLLAAALERIPAIEAPQEPRDGPQSAPEASEGASPRSGGVGAQEGVQEPQEERRPWWVRWFGG